MLGPEQPHAAQVCRLNGLHRFNAYNYMDYYSFTDPEWMDG